MKAAALSRVMAEDEVINEVIIHTGQHYERNMSDVFFDEMSLPAPAYNLGIMGGGHGSMTGQMLVKIEEVLLMENPEAVLVYGDTNSTLAGALAAKKLQIPLVHVEAGLRSFNMAMPEEINRVLTDRISDLLFCPTLASYENLAKEGFGGFNSSIFISGDIMLDAALWFEEISDKKNRKVSVVPEQDFVLATFHRAENTDNDNHLESIIDAFNQIAATGYEVILPVHPRTRKAIANKKLHCNFKVIDPVGYLDMIQLIKHCTLVMTDSGGLQKEAYFFKKNCITLRNETEWVELVENGYNYIAGMDTGTILKAFHVMKDKKEDFIEGLYGKGNAAQLIVSELRNYFAQK